MFPPPNVNEINTTASRSERAQAELAKPSIVSDERAPSTQVEKDGLGELKGQTETLQGLYNVPHRLYWDAWERFVKNEPKN